MHVPEETVWLQTRCFAPLPPRNFLLLLHLPVQKNRTQLAEVSPEDIKEFNTITAQKQVIKMGLSKYKE